MNCSALNGLFPVSFWSSKGPQRRRDSGPGIFEAGINWKPPQEAAAIRTAECQNAYKILKARPILAGEIDGSTEVNAAWLSVRRNGIEYPRHDFSPLFSEDAAKVLHDTGARSGGGIYPDQIGTTPSSSNVALSYPSADGLLCGFSFLPYIEPRSSAESAQLRAT